MSRARRSAPYPVAPDKGHTGSVAPGFRMAQPAPGTRKWPQLVFWAGLGLALVGVFGWNGLVIVTKGSIASGNYTAIDAGAILIFVGLGLMATAFVASHRSSRGIRPPRSATTSHSGESS